MYKQRRVEWSPEVHFGMCGQIGVRKTGKNQRRPCDYNMNLWTDRRTGARPPISLYLRHRGSWPPITFSRPKHTILAPSKLSHEPDEPFWPERPLGGGVMFGHTLMRKELEQKDALMGLLLVGRTGGAPPSPEGCLQLFQRALQLYPGLTEASYWSARPPQ